MHKGFVRLHAHLSLYGMSYRMASVVSSPKVTDQATATVDTKKQERQPDIHHNQDKHASIPGHSLLQIASGLHSDLRLPAEPLPTLFCGVGRAL